MKNPKKNWYYILGIANSLFLKISSRNGDGVEF